jgi:NADH-quinone oxidoreductase subunit N
MSAVSLYYYFRIVVYMYQEDETASTPVPLRSPAVVGTIVVCAVVTLLLGLYPGPFIEWARAASLPLP